MLLERKSGCKCVNFQLVFYRLEEARAVPRDCGGDAPFGDRRQSDVL